MKVKQVICCVLAITLLLTGIGCGNNREQVDISAIIGDENIWEGTSLITDTVVNNLKASDIYKDYLSEKDCETVVFSGKEVTCESSKITVSEDSITITEGGIFELKGEYEGTVYIDATKDDKVYLVLNGVILTALSGPAIHAKKCDKLVICLYPGSENFITDPLNYEDTSDDAPTGCIFAKSDLSINGSGQLKVLANHNDGIVSKDDLVITGGNITIDAMDDGIVGRDSLTITDGTIQIISEGQGIKTTNDENDDKGIAIICGGSIDINSKSSAISSVNDITIEKAVMTISSQKKGIHSDKGLFINSGVLKISRSKEGLEATKIVINGGNIDIKAADDGINVNGGADEQRGGFGGFVFDKKQNDSKQDPLENNTMETPLLEINGGNIVINASGDGIDSNGNITMSGGYVLVSGSSDNGNNATDYNGTFIMTGGTVIAIGSSGMYQSISEGSSCFVIDYFANATIAENTECTLVEGETDLFNFTIAKKGNAIMIASDKLEKDKEYKLVLGKEATTVTAKEASGTTGGFGAFGGMGDRPGRGGNFNEGDKRGNGWNNGDMTPPGDRPEGAMPEGGNPFWGNRPDNGGNTTEKSDKNKDF